MRLMNRLQVWAYGMLLCCVWGCSTSDDSINTEPIVMVGKHVLTKGMLYEAIPNSANAEDSATLAQGYINRWVGSELMVRKAELNLTKKELDVDVLLEEYRRSLIIHKYQQKLLEQKYSPLITGREIERYYDNNSDDFKLSQPILKGYFVIVPQASPNLKEKESLFRWSENESLVDLEAYCFQFAKKYELFPDQWRQFSKINNMLPDQIRKPSEFLKYNKYRKTSDSIFNYYISVKEYMLEGEIAPLEYVEEKIKAIILRQKRLEFIKQLESELYDEGMEQEIINFY